MLFVVPDRRRHRAGGERRAVLPERSRRPVRGQRRAASAAVSLAAGRSVSRFPPAPEGRIGACPGPARHGRGNGEGRRGVRRRPLLPRVPDPVAVFLASCEVKPGIDLDPQRVTQVLAAGGYEPQDPVDAHGEFFRRGGILDIFPPTEAMPIRIEFIGDTVESIRRFDPGTQRSVETLDQFVIVPAREDGLTDTETGTPLPADGRLPSTIFDYVRARDSRFFVAEPDDVRKQIETSWTQLEASYVEREGRPGPPPRPPAELSLSWTDVEAALTEATSLEQLGVDQTDSPETLQVPCQPATLFHGRVPDWVADVRQALTRNETVIVVAGTHGRVERTVELLRDYEVRALPATEAGDVLAGAVIVAEGWLSAGFRLPSAGFQVYAETDVFEEERRRTTGDTNAVAERDLPLGSPRSQGQRPHRSCRSRHRALRRSAPDLGRAGRHRSGVHRASLPRRRQVVRPGRAPGPHPEIHRRRQSSARPPRRNVLGKGEDEGQEGHARHGRGAAEALRRSSRRPRSRLRRRHALAGGVRRSVRVRTDAGPGDGHRRHQARHGVADADGPPALWRRGLRQDRGGDARGVQGRHGRQADRRARPDHGVGVAAPQDLHRSLRGVSRSNRHGQPLPHQGRDRADARGACRRAARHHRRHPSPAVEGCEVSRSRACSSSTKSSGLAWRTKSGSSSCARPSTC